MNNFRAINKYGQLYFEDPVLFDMYLSTLPKNVFVEVSKEKKKRSIPQNKMLWGYIYPPLANFLGYSVSDIHDICKLKLNSALVTVGKDEFRVGKSTASLTTTEFKKYVSDIIIWASLEFGVVIKDPDWEEYEKDIEKTKTKKREKKAGRKTLGDNQDLHQDAR